MTQQYPLIGTAMWVKKDGKILLGVRAKEKSAGAGSWCPPGGHLEMHETIEEGVVRETREEASIEVNNVQLMTYIEDPRATDGSHYVTFHYVCDWLSGDPQPQAGESENWQWFNWENLPQPLFKPALDFVARSINPLEFKG